VIKRLTLDVLHHKIGAPFFDLRVEDADDVRVIQLCSNRRLREEELAHAARPFALITILVAEVDQFDRHQFVQVIGLAEVDRGGRPFADFRITLYLPMRSSINLMAVRTS
jgi:hypothetical protein